MSTVTMNVRMEESTRRNLDEVATAIGMTSSAVVNVLVKRFVDERGFPFPVREYVPTEAEFAAEMDRRYEEMLAGNFTNHDLIEV